MSDVWVTIFLFFQRLDFLHDCENSRINQTVQCDINLHLLDKTVDYKEGRKDTN